MRSTPLQLLAFLAVVLVTAAGCTPGPGEPSPDEKFPPRAFLFSTGEHKIAAGSESPGGLLLIAVRPGGSRSDFVLPDAERDKPILLSPDGRKVLYTARPSIKRGKGAERIRGALLLLDRTRIRIRDLASGETREVAGLRYSGDRVGAYDWLGDDVVMVAFLGKRAPLKKHRPQNKATLVVYSGSKAETLAPIPADSVRVAGRTRDGSLYLEAWAGDPKYYGLTRHGLWRVKTDGNAELQRMPYKIPGGPQRATTTTTSVGAFFDPRGYSDEWSVMDLATGRQVRRAKVSGQQLTFTPGTPSASPPAHLGVPVFDADYTHYLQQRGKALMEGDATTSGKPTVMLSLSTEDSDPLAYVGDSRDFTYEDVLALYEKGKPRKVQLLLYRRSDGRSVALAELTKRGPIRFLGETPVAPQVSR